MSFQLEPFRSSTSRMEIAQSTLTGGALSIEVEGQFMQMVEVVIQSSLGELVKSRARIDTALNDFITESSKANKKFSEYTLQISQDLIEGRIVEQVKIQNAKFLCSLATQVGKRYAETAEQLLQLEELNREGKFEDYAGAIDLVYKARIEHLKYVQSKMELLQAQENHELQIFISIHNQKLKEESQKVDQMMKMANFTAQEKEREFRRRIDIRKQKMQEEEDLLSLAQANQSLDRDFKRMEQQCEKEIADLKNKIKSYA